MAIRDITMAESQRIIIYGANGYSAKLIAEECMSRGIKPILAGRSEKKVAPVAKSMGLDYRAADVKDKSALNDLVLEADIFLNCAGPFVHTFRPIVESCIYNRTHYLDITGEYEVLEELYTYDDVAKEAKVMLLPAVGFDVVPTDCLAAMLNQEMPGATHLYLAFYGVKSQISHGTMNTIIENMDKGGAIRRDGEIVKVPTAHKTATIQFYREKKLCMCIPWGDLSTAYRSTGIPNIEVFTTTTERTLTMLKRVQSMGWLFRRDFIKRALQQQQMRFRKAGPNRKQRSRGSVFIWGQVVDAEGNKHTARINTPEGYQLTVLTSVKSLEKVLAGEVKYGFQTPSTAFGANFIMEIEGVQRFKI